jgi:hypothetical protein
MIGVVVDGQSEYIALPKLFRRIRQCDTLRVARGAIDAGSPAGAVAKASKSSIRQLQQLGAKLVVLLIDREEREECPGLCVP